jgi:hypothetical protein
MVPRLGVQGTLQPAGTVAGSGTAYSTIPPVESVPGAAVVRGVGVREAEGVDGPDGPEQAAIKPTQTSMANRTIVERSPTPAITRLLV